MALSLFGFLLVGCGGGGGSDDSPSRVGTRARLLIEWAAANGAAPTSPANARSGRVTLRGAGVDGGDIDFVVDRPDGDAAASRTYETPADVNPGERAVSVDFYNQPGAGGSRLARAIGRLIIANSGETTTADRGNGITTQETAAAVTVMPGQQVAVGQQGVELEYAVTNGGGQIVAASTDPAAVQVRVVSGGEFLSVTNNLLRGIAPGTAQVTVTAGGVTSAPVAVQVTGNGTTPPPPTGRFTVTEITLPGVDVANVAIYALSPNGRSLAGGDSTTNFASVNGAFAALVTPPNGRPIYPPGFGGFRNINDLGQVALFTQAEIDVIVDSYVWQNGSYVPVSDSGSAGNIYAYDINNDGYVVGETSGGGNSRPFLWRNGSLSRLPLPQGDDQGGAVAISPAGLIAGVTRGSGRDRIVLWNTDGIIVATGTPLENPDGDYDIIGVTDAGQVLVRVSPDGGAGTPALWQNGQQTPLTQFQSVQAINNNGAVLGVTNEGGSALLLNGTLIRLRDEFPASSDWTIGTATALSDSGQIVCNATSNRDGRAAVLLLTPRQ